ALRRTVDCYCGLNPRWEDGAIVVRARRSGLSCRSSGVGVLAAAGDAVVPELNLYCRAFPVAERDRRARGRDRLMRRAILAGVLLALIGAPLWAHWPRPRLAAVERVRAGSSWFTGCATGGERSAGSVSRATGPPAASH